MLGGPEGTTLFALCADAAEPSVAAGAAAGALYATEVAVPHAGRP